MFGVDAVEAPDVGKLLGKASNDDIVVTGKRQKVEERQKNKNNDINRRLVERKYNINDFERTVNGLLDKLDGLKYNKKELKLLKNN